ncbi:cysteine dioxygenase [Alcaligenaceae bacterium B3P038]|nr:cysteine dioxygenase [Alcaligenaceae bacterium B3P038]
MNITRLREFVVSATRLMDATPAHVMPSDALLAAFTDLVSHDDWLPESCARSDPDRYQQHLLHCDPLERFSLVSFVWGPGQRTPVHDHGVWGYVGMLRGAETGQRFVRRGRGFEADGSMTRLEPGDVDILLPAEGDVHQVANAFADRTSISVHLYGGNIGAIARHVYDPATGAAKPFISGYSSPDVPNLWDRSSG